MLTEREGKILLEMAREAIETYVRKKERLAFTTDEPAFKTESGAFVTIKKYGELRGCIGTFASANPLHRTVTDMAISAAIGDPRFIAVTERELDEISLEISVLSPLKEIKSIDEIVIGVHGLYIVKERSHGVLLPQVATEHDMDRLSFLEHTAMKAGLEPNAWRRDDARIFTFEAQIFKEEQAP